MNIHADVTHHGPGSGVWQRAQRLADGFKVLIAEEVGVEPPPSPHLFVDGEDWYAIQTEARQEKLATAGLIGHRVATWLPMVFFDENGGGARKTRLACRPMLPGIMFARCAPDERNFSRIRATPGVHLLMHSHGEQPAPLRIRRSELEVLVLHEMSCEAKRLADANARRTRSGRLWSFSVGDIVRILDGPFASFFAELETCVNEFDRVRVALSIFGRETAMEISAFHVEAARCDVARDTRGVLRVARESA